MSSYERRGNYIVPVGSHDKPRAGTTRNGVECLTGKGGTMILRIGPNFGSINIEQEPDPTPALQAELAAQRAARSK